ncbi:MAG: helix-turn-helix domain-containing protein [Desulfotignum sp.]|nr:helix-turn-helix domain-containing protein [Desulfotignum sp.]
MEKKHIARTLAQLDWNKSRAARLLQITLPTLRSKIKKYRISTPVETACKKICHAHGNFFLSRPGGNKDRLLRIQQKRADPLVYEGDLFYLISSTNCGILFATVE